RGSSTRIGSRLPAIRSRGCTRRSRGGSASLSRGRVLPAKSPARANRRPPCAGRWSRWRGFEGTAARRLSGRRLGRLGGDFDRGCAVVLCVSRDELTHDRAVPKSRTGHVAPAAFLEDAGKRQNSVKSVHSQLGDGGGAVVTVVARTDRPFVPKKGRVSGC